MNANNIISGLEGIIDCKNIRIGKALNAIDPGMSSKNLDADIAVSPENIEQLTEVIKFCEANSIEIVPQGGRTGISGAAESLPGQLIVQTSSLDQITNLDFVAGTAIVESGVTLQQLQEAIEPYGFGVGIDLAARGTATIGGMVSTNAGGTEAFRYGVTRHRVLGLEAVLADGEIFSDMKQVTKANEGYDVKQLLIGAEGTLGIITKVVLNLVPLDKNRFTALLSCKNAVSAAAVFQTLRNDPRVTLLCAEIMWPDYANTTARALGMENLLDFAHSEKDVFVIIDISCAENKAGVDVLEEILSELLSRESITSALIAQNQREATDFWKIREESFLCDKAYPHGFWYDMSVPLSHLDDYTTALYETIASIDSELKVFLFGHLGDGNLHLTVTSGIEAPQLESQINVAVYEGLNDIGGSFSAEHGIGNQKRDSLQKYTNSQKMKIMKSVKNILDPQGIMNPGKIFQPEEGPELMAALR